jgi:hypothetical protein
MGALAKLVDNILGKDAIALTFVRDLADPGLGLSGSAIEPDQCYIEIYVESLQLKRARKFATQFHGLVYSFARLSQEMSEDARLAAVSKPDRLAELDASNLDRVIVLSKRMMGAVPWRGGTLGLELGLFSVKKGNLLTPFLNYVVRVSELGGISFVGQVKPFLPLISEGLELISGQTQDAAIEVAVDADLTLSSSGLCGIIAVPRDSIDTSKLTLDPSDCTLLLEGKALQEAYCVFSIRRTDQKADYGAIPEIKAAWSGVSAAILANNKPQADEALSMFKRTVLMSPDLISRDRQGLIQKAMERVSEAFPRGPAPVGRAPAVAAAAIELSDLRLYE